MTRARLALVPPEPEAPVDINALQRVDIARRDWSRVMIEGDRRRPIELADAPKRTWFR